MSLRIIEISAPDKASDKIKELAEKNNAIDCWQTSRKSWFGKNEEERSTTRILVDVKNQQELMDALTRRVQSNDGWRILLLAVEATLPTPEELEKNNNKSDTSSKETGLKKWFDIKNILQGSVTREELLQDMEKGGRLNLDFMLLVFLSSIVAGIGLMQSDVAIIIGAMVIAPLLGPNLALAFGAALGSRSLIASGVKTNLIGLSFTLVIAIIGSLLISPETVLNSTEMMNRTNVGYASIILALASGAAAVLSLTAGVSSALVGVMVAVALMPPAVTLGVTIGNTQWQLAYGAFLLLATNVVCVNLSALAVFRLKGIKPRTWFEEKKAKKASKINALIWLSSLIFLAILIWLKKDYMGG